MSFIIGEIVKAQGVRGEVKIRPYTDDPARYGQLRTVSVGGCPMKIRGVNVRGGFVYIAFEGVNTRNDAEVLVGRTVEIDRSQAKRPEPGEFFVADLLGCRVFLSDGSYIGVLSDIENYGSADIFTVKGGRTVRFPHLARLGLSYDEKARSVTLDAAAFAEVCCYED